MAIHMPIIGTEGDAISIFQEFKQTSPVFQRDSLPLFSQSIYCTHILRPSEALLERRSEMRKSYGKLSRNTVVMDISKEGCAWNQLVTGCRLSQYPNRALAVNRWQITVLVPRETVVPSGSWKSYHSMDYMCHSMVYTMKICHCTNHCHLPLSCEFFNQG